MFRFVALLVLVVLVVAAVGAAVALASGQGADPSASALWGCGQRCTD